jgi:hypothetical protein
VSSLRVDAPLLGREHPPQRPRAGFGEALTITVVFAAAAALALIAAQLLVVHSNISPSSPYHGLINQQNQSVKTDVYLITFLVILPLALVAGPRTADAIADGPNGNARPAFAASLAGTLAAALIVIRLSGGLPWGDGVKGLLAGVLVWAALAGGALWRVLRGGPWAPLERLQRVWPVPLVLAALLVFGVLLCLTSSSSLGAVPLLVGGVAAALVLVLYRRTRLPRVGRWGWAIDALVVAVLLLAVPDVVGFKNPTGIPNIFVDPGIVQFQHDYILGSVNQVLGGGTLLAGDPVSQYGVGLIYFVAGWFHIAPIGYGTFALLDSLLTALFYIAGYAVLRLAGVRRPLAAAAIALGVVALVYNFLYFVGQLPEEGPLRFGLPMIVLLGSVAANRLPRAAPIARVVALVGLAVAAVWAFEAFAYTAVTYVAVVAVEAWTREPGSRPPRPPRPARRRWLLRWLAYGIGAVAAGHAVFALATLAGSGHLPDWGQYLAYGREFLLGGKAGSITYGFASWSPGLAVYGGALISAAALVLLIWRRPELARANPARTVALAGSTFYTIAILSYTDNRSSTYLFVYVALPLLIAGTLWLALILGPASGLSPRLRLSGLGAALAVSVLLLAGAWPQVGTHFNRSALAHFYPGGGLRAALHRLWHAPPIDPRTPVGIALLDRYVHGRRVIILLPTVPDLGTEILIRSHRSNLLPIGDPKADGLVPSVWLPRVRAALGKLRPGQRVLIDDQALKAIKDLRKPGVDPLKAPIDGGGVEAEWILRYLDRRFEIKPVARAPDGLIVAELVRR